jgi:hypothetical protein
MRKQARRWVAGFAPFPIGRAALVGRRKIRVATWNGDAQVAQGNSGFIGP